MSMHDTLSQSCCLYRKDFFAMFLEFVTLRHKRTRVKTTSQFQRFVDNKLCDNVLHIKCRIGFISYKRIIRSTFRTNTLHINLTNDKLLFKTESLTTSQQCAVFVNQSVATKDNICCRLAKATRR